MEIDSVRRRQRQQHIQAKNQTAQFLFTCDQVSIVKTFKFDKVDEWDNIISVYADHGGIIGLRSDGSLLYVGDNEEIQASTVNSWKLW